MIDVQVADAEFYRLLGYPRGREPEGPRNVGPVCNRPEVCLAGCKPAPHFVPASYRPPFLGAVGAG